MQCQEKQNFRSLKYIKKFYILNIQKFSVMTYNNMYICKLFYNKSIEIVKIYFTIIKIEIKIEFYYSICSILFIIVFMSIEYFSEYRVFWTIYAIFIMPKCYT